MDLSTWSLEDLQLAKTYLLIKTADKTLWCAECRDFTKCYLFPQDDEDDQLVKTIAPDDLDEAALEGFEQGLVEAVLKELNK